MALRVIPNPYFEPDPLKPQFGEWERGSIVQRWDGAKWVDVEDIQGGDVALSAVTYNGSGQVTGYTTGGVAYVVAYPDSTHVTISGGGKVITITLDGAGRVIGKTVA